MNVSFYPLSFLPINPYQTKPVTFNPEYVNNLIALRITDYFLPTQFASNPLFAKVDEFHQKIGILQTATNAVDKILSYVDILKNINEPTEDILKEISKEINSTVKNTTFNDLPVFNQTLKIGDKDFSLSIPVFNPDEMSIEEYEKLLLEKKESFIDALKEFSLQTPFSNTKINPVDFETFSSILKSGSLLQAYNTNLINPLTLELLLSLN
ncbi:hypothetical protein [Caminibacter sp.]